MVRRTKEEAQETRSRILDAAERVFYEKGVAHASLEDIAAAAEVTRGAIYWHFKDKAEIFDAMMCSVMMPAEDMMGCRERDPDAPDPLEVLRRSAIDVLMRTARDPRTRRVMEIAYHKCEYVGDAAGVRERHIASQNECLDTIEAGFRACVKGGHLPRGVNPREAAIGVMSLVSGLIANYVLDPASFSLEKHAEPLVDAYFRGLAVEPVARVKVAAGRKAARV
jgi:TetR/AcrR family transcriptional regulator, acrAB operon repressor